MPRPLAPSAGYSEAAPAQLGADAIFVPSWHLAATRVPAGLSFDDGGLRMTDLHQPAAPPVPEPATAEDAGASPPPAPPKSSATRRVRARIARRMTPQRAGPVAPVLEPLASVHRSMHPKADLALLQRAYDVAEAKHEGQKRKSGDPYITHPLAVATILAELGMDTTTLVAALLHDTVEDTGYSVEQLRADFGEEVAHLVDGVTKLDKVELGNA